MINDDICDSDSISSHWRLFAALQFSMLNVEISSSIYRRKEIIANRQQSRFREDLARERAEDAEDVVEDERAEGVEVPHKAWSDLRTSRPGQFRH